MELVSTVYHQVEERGSLPSGERGYGGPAAEFFSGFGDPRDPSLTWLVSRGRVVRRSESTRTDHQMEGE